MRILVAGGACAVLKMERQNLVRSSAQSCFVALGTGNGNVSSSQHEMRFLVLGNREGRSVNILYRMAVFAAVQVRRGGKLLVMLILVAIRASREFHFVLSILAGWGVALVTSNGSVFSIERIFRCRVFFYAE